MNREQLTGQGAVLATALLWSTSGLFIKLLEWHPIVISGMRSIVAGIFLLAVRLIVPPPKGIKNPRFPFWASAFCYALTMLTFVIANKLTTTANAVMLQYGAPVWAALLGWALVREKPRWEQWGALVLVFAGLFLFFRDDLGSGAFTGDIMAFISGIFFGANSVFLRMQKDGTPRDAMLMAHWVNAAICVPFIFMHPPVFTVSSSLTLLYMGALQVGLAAILFSYGIQLISAIKAMLTATIEPVLSPVWVLIVTGERPSSAALAGGTVIIIAILASSLIGNYRETRMQPI